MLNLAGRGPAGVAGVTAAKTLMAGLGPRLAKRTVQTAALWTLYEELWTVWERREAAAAARRR